MEMFFDTNIQKSNTYNMFSKEDEKTDTLTDTNRALEDFKARLRGGYYVRERSQNTEVDYDEEKAQRDRDAVHAFLASDEFAILRDI